MVAKGTFGISGLRNGECIWVGLDDRVEVVVDFGDAGEVSTN